MKHEYFSIYYKAHIPDKLIEAFKQLQIANQIGIELTIEKEDENYLNFTGFELNDIVILIEKSGLKFGLGILKDIASDFIKKGLKSLWLGVSKKTKETSIETNPPKILLKVKNKDREVEILFEGNVDERQANKMIDNVFEFVNSSQIEAVFANPQFSITSTNPKILLEFNKLTQAWQPHNFEEYKRNLDEVEKWLKENNC